MKLEIGDKKKTVLGIAIPEEFRKDPRVLEICGKFRRDMKLWNDRDAALPRSGFFGWPLDLPGILRVILSGFI